MGYQSLKKRIKKNEGFFLKPYKDQLGNPTIGYGHLIKKNEKIYFSKKFKKTHFSKLFEKDFMLALQSFSINLKKFSSSNRDKELFIEMAFQMGIKKVLKFKKLIQHVKNKKKYLAALEMMDSLWYHQTPKRVENLIKNYLYK